MLTVRSGHIAVLRLFEVAYSIDLRRVEEVWARHAGSASSRSRAYLSLCAKRRNRKAFSRMKPAASFWS